MTASIRYLQGVPYRQFRTVFPGARLYLVSGDTIAIEHWAYEPGQHEFDYEVNSRAMAGGRPIPISVRRESMAREFMERRVISRSPVPISIGDSNGNRIPEVRMTYGEVAPQIYSSRVPGNEIAWSLMFKSHRLVSTQGAIGTAASIIRPNANVSASAARSAAAQNMPTGFNYLMLWVPVAQFNRTRVLPNGLGVTDIVWEDPSLTQRIINWARGQ